jgi:carboxyvinyl-carboxyphosphonate phosphorylmutase
LSRAAAHPEPAAQLEEHAMPHRWSDRRTRFRAILNGERCVYPASTHEPVAARIAEHLGFEVGMLAGSTGALAILGAPDLITITLSEFAEQALRVNRAFSLPLMVDADHGYGNALSVMRTVEELEAAGVAGLSIEDTLLPRAYGPSDAPTMIPLEEGVGKMRAAVAARRDPDLVIAGRTSAPQIAGVEETIRRAKAYEATGVDCIFLVGVKTRAELDAIAPALRLPIILGTATPEIMDRDYLSSRRVRICLQGHLPFQASIKAIHDTLQALREGTPPGKVGGMPSPELVRVATGADDYARWTREFLGGSGA